MTFHTLVFAWLFAFVCFVLVAAVTMIALVAPAPALTLLSFLLGMAMSAIAIIIWLLMMNPRRLV